MKAKNEFYYIEELKTYVKLSEITSFKLHKEMKNLPDSFYQCCIVVGKSVYWCNQLHFTNLKTILL